MRGIAKWVALLFIAVVALSPIFEIFDKTDGWRQDSSDLLRYIFCLFCFLAFSLRRTAVAARLWSFRSCVIRPQRPPIERKSSGHSLPTATDLALFLTFHDLRI
jgi:hypothetical protein